MNIDTIKNNTRSKKSRFLLGTLLFFSTSLAQADSLPVLLGPPVRISPIPGPDNPDPVLENLEAFMDNHYQPPFYPGGTPDYLSQIYLSANVYSANNIRFNPCNDAIMISAIGQNSILDFTGIFGSPTLGTNTLAISRNRGSTWKYIAPVEQIIPLGGDISQIINSSLGPGLYNVYDKNGRLYATGWGFFDMVANPPNAVPQSGFLFSTSDDNGEHWKNPRIWLASNINTWWFPGSIGIGPREFLITPDPANPEIIHSETMFFTSPFLEWGNLFYSKSTDGGKNFPPFRQVYSMIDDPVWRAKYFDPTVTDPTYYVYGGFSLISSLPTKYDDNLLLLPIARLNLKGFPVSFNIPMDQAVVRSFDNGETFEREAGATELSVLPGYLHDPAFDEPINGTVINGVFTFPFFRDTAGQGSSALVSSVTGRIYLTYEAINTAISNFDTFNTINYILLSSSSDKGAKFSKSVQINKTPTDIQIGAQQAFAHGAAMTADGYYVVAYYDFRNWSGSPGEDVLTTPLQTDAWLDVYRETKDPHGGSTGVGLDYVGEIRLTPESFNARINNLTPTNFPYAASFITGTPEGIPITVNNNNELFVLFSMQTGEGVSSSNVTTGYKGMTIDTNPYMTLFLQRLNFPNVSNQ